MRTTVTIEDELLQNAKKLSGIQETNEVIRHALRKYVQREAAMRLARLGGTMPDFTVPPRDRRERAIEDMIKSDESGDESGED